MHRLAELRLLRRYVGEQESNANNELFRREKLALPGRLSTTEGEARAASAHSSSELGIGLFDLHGVFCFDGDSIWWLDPDRVLDLQCSPMGRSD